MATENNSKHWEHVVNLNAQKHMFWLCMLNSSDWLCFNLLSAVYYRKASSLKKEYFNTSIPYSILVYHTLDISYLTRNKIYNSPRPNLDIIFIRIKPYKSSIVSRNGHIKLADFGLCKLLHGERSCDIPTGNRMCLCQFSNELPAISGAHPKTTRSCCGTLVN